MVGGRRDEGSFTINSSNGFSALESLRKKKKSDKVKKSNKSSSKATSKEPEPQVFWAPAPLNAKSWADVDDEDDDDYFATTAPPQAVWKTQEPQPSKEGPAAVEESESEDDMLDLGDDDDVEEEHDHEEEEVVHPEPVVAQRAPEVPAPARENERQLSKKELKKKDLEEFEALLADLGVTLKDTNGQGDAQEKKDGELKKGEASDNGDKNAAPSESKNAKKKKKKDKSSKEAKETLDHPNGSEVNGEHNDSATEVKHADEESSTVDVKERLKKVAAARKKKSGKELDGAAKAAAQEAAARSAKLAAAKKKEKNHYNQHPVR